MDILKSNGQSEEAAIRGDVAIIGMACVFPGSPDLQTYWKNILAGVDAVKDVPKGRWDSEVHFTENSNDINKVYCKRGGYLDEFMTFDPLEYGVMPVGIEGGEPDQFLVLQVVHEALKDAGYLRRDFDGRKAEFILGRGNYLGVGASNLIQRSIVTEQTLKILQSLHPEYTTEELAEIRKELISCLPKLGPETAGSFIPNLTAGRVANRLDLMGPNFTLDAACASSLIAAEIGVRDLLTGKCDLAMIGGVHIFANVPFLLIFCAFHAMSLSSQIRPFDKHADGTIPGEGVGIAVLKRLLDAERDGDRIYAVIKGVGTASDGRAVSVTAPRVEGEELALRRAYEMSRISPGTVRLIEAHGVGTTVGDIAELEALRRVFGPRDELGPRCALGSVKSMIGHAMPAAGIAGLIKAALAVYHKVLPPTLHCRQINPKLEIGKTPFYINTATRPWIHGEGNFPRRAGINAFGFGGINAHLVLEEYKTPGGEVTQKTSPHFWDTEVCIFHGDSRQMLTNQIRDLKKFLDRNPSLPLRDVAYTLNTSLPDHSYRLAVVAFSVDDLREKLSYALKRLSDPECHQIKDIRGIYFFESPLSKEGKLAFMFPGEGAQYLHMLADLCIHFPEVRSCFDKVDRLLLDKGQADVPSLYIFPPPFFSREEQLAAENLIWRMDRATEAVLIGNLAMYTLLKALGLKPDQMVGHSAGEWSAMIFSGIIDADEFLQNTRRLNQIYLRLSEDPDIPKATLLAAGTSRDQIDPVIEQLEGTMYVANDNCPHQVVIIGEEKVAEKAVQYLRGRGIPFEKLSFNRGYHTPLFSAICPHLREYFSAFTISPPQVEIYSCNTMAPYPTDPGKILKLAVETWVLPVAFRQTIENMHASGTRIFVEAGPKGNLTAFVEDILRGKPHLAIPSNVARRSGITQLNHMVGLLSAQGISLNLEYLYQYRSPQILSWAEGNRLPASKGKGIKIPLGLYSIQARKHEPKETAQVRSMPPDFPSQSPPFSVMEQYFQTMDHFLDTQKEMMQVYLERGQNLTLPDPVWPDLPDTDWKQTDRSEDAAEPESTAESDHRPVQTFQEVIEKPAEEEGTSPAADGNRTASEGQAHPSSFTEEDIDRILMELVSEKTGYPQEMIDVHADMEGDLGIDSIKRVEIIGSFREQYTQIGEEDVATISALKTLQQVIDFLKKKMENPLEPGRAPGTSPESIAQNLPFTGRVVDLKPGKSLVIVREVNLQEDLFLEDHRFGQHISELDSSLGALPVIPLTVSLEIMAEAASLLFPGQKLIRVEKVSASQWICLEEEEPITLQITAEVLSQGQVQVRIHNLGQGSTPLSGQKPVITGEMFFAESYPSPSLPAEFILEEDRSPSHTAEQVYSEHRMFHGPRFQGIRSMDRVGKNGLKAHLQILPPDHIFRSQPKPSFLTDPFLLDAAGQLVGYWPVEYLDSGFVIFPIAIRALHIYQETPPPLTPLQTRMKLREVTNSKILADLDIFGLDGKLWVQIIGWQDWRFYWSRELYDFWRFPNRGFIGRLWEPPARVVPEGEPSPSFSLLLQFWRGNDDLFQHVMAYMVLSRREREIYRGLPAGKSQGEWLLKRMAAKDAVRSFIRKHYQRNLYPADIDMTDDEGEQPRMDKNLKGEPWPVPNLSVACTEDAAAAMAGRVGQAVGIHLAKIHDPKRTDGAWELPSEEKTALSALTALDEADQNKWIRRLWVAKGAAARALDCHTTDEAMRSMTIQGLELHSGWVRIKVEGSLREKKLPGHHDGLVQVFTTQEAEYIIAITIY